MPGPGAMPLYVSSRTSGRTEYRANSHHQLLLQLLNARLLQGLAQPDDLLLVRQDVCRHGALQRAELLLGRRCPPDQLGPLRLERGHGAGQLAQLHLGRALRHELVVVLLVIAPLPPQALDLGRQLGHVRLRRLAPVQLLLQLGLLQVQPLHRTQQLRVVPSLLVQHSAHLHLRLHRRRHRVRWPLRRLVLGARLGATELRNRPGVDVGRLLHFESQLVLVLLQRRHPPLQLGRLPSSPLGIVPIALGRCGVARHARLPAG
mmetsp:Transcript_11970/g.39328  ORF Transcript_11970/g.39328 Transcript_11970/m.39328 type:complete len:261 (-) Transcript_11970:970-1752(-)